MTERKLKERIGIFLLIINTVQLTLVFVFYIVLTGNSYEVDELMTVLSLILPMYSLYITGFLKYVVDYRTKIKDYSKPVTGLFCSLSFTLISIYSLYILTIIILRTINFIDIDLLKYLVGASQLAFGVYIATLFVSRQPGFPTFDKCFFLSSAKENAG